MSRSVAVSVFLALSFDGWVLEVAGVASLQGILDVIAQGSISGNVLAYTSTAYEYVWWVGAYAERVCA